MPRIGEHSHMWIGFNEFDVLLGDVHSLKGKRSVVRPIISEIRRRFEISVAEVGDVDLHRRTRLGVSVVGSERTHVEEILNKVEDFIARRPEVELLSAKLRIIHADDF